MLPSLPKACQLVGKNWPYPTAPAEEVAMLRPKSDSTRAIAASRCQGTPQLESFSAWRMAARWSWASVGTKASQSSSGLVGVGLGLGSGVAAAKAEGSAAAA